VTEKRENRTNGNAAPDFRACLQAFLVPKNLDDATIVVCVELIAPETATEIVIANYRQVE
jgi:hypothetical protein